MTTATQHIDRKSLYTSLDARIDYLHRFLDFNSEDISALAFGSKFVKDLIPAVVHIVYRKLLQFDVTARAFEVRDTRSSEPLKNVLEEGSPELEQRKIFLNSYLLKICSDQSQMAFWEWLDQVGAMHVGLRRKRPLHVEYIHISATLCLIQSVLTEAILTHNLLPMSKRVSMVKAIGKVIWIQNDLFAKWYVRDGDEFAEDAAEDAAAAVERLNSDVHTAELKQHPTNKEAGVCPFTGMGNAMQGLSVGGSGSK